MVRRLIRQLVLLVTLGAFLSAGVTQAMPSAAVMAAPEMAMAMPMAMDTAAEEGDAMPCHKDPVPCQEQLPGCMLDLGCVFLIGLPMPSPLSATTLSWSTVTYWGRSDDVAGLSRKPALHPPISLV